MGCEGGKPGDLIQHLHLWCKFTSMSISELSNRWSFFFTQWQRAETLGALVNGVFLVALCMSIFLEATQRLVEPQEVKNPRFVCIVGCFGLASNIIGLVLFHDHSHGHGGGHDHGDHDHDEHDHEHDIEAGDRKSVV